MDVIVRCCCRQVSTIVSGSMVDMWLLLLGGCFRQVSLVVSLGVLQTGGCYCKVVSIGR